MNSFPVARPWIREGAERPRIEVRGPILAGVAVVASICAVFACFFAIGRATDGGSVSHEEALSVAVVNAPVPVHLGSAPALFVASVASAQPHQSSQSSSARAVSAPVQSFSSEASRAPLSAPQSAPAISRSAPAVSQAPQSPPPSTSAPPAQAPPSHAGGPPAKPAKSSGGSFDISG